jgi:hypothetical protein
MGLHVERPKPRQTQLDREMRRRIWHCCLVLDRYIYISPSVVQSFANRLPFLVC